jgi:2',3'-cyclic-nucleotide 2'-phosphodiesterase (5'-nucleotidase family)
MLHLIHSISRFVLSAPFHVRLPAKFPTRFLSKFPAKFLSRLPGKGSGRWLSRALLVMILTCVLGVAAAPAQDPDLVRLSVFHVNDWHGTLESTPALWLNPDSPPVLGGPAVLATALRHFKLEALKRGEPYLLVDAGDRFQGTLEVNLSRGQFMSPLFNRLGFQFGALGNHEFDYGQPALFDSLRAARFAILCANLQAEKPLWKPAILVERRGVKIGLFGLLTDELPLVTFPENLKGLTQEKAMVAARRETANLRRRGAEFVVALSHCGHPFDLELASSVSGIDLIVGGHTAEHLEQPRRIGNTLIVQSRGYGTHLGALSLTWNRRTREIATYAYSLAALDPLRFPPDEDVARFLASETRSYAAAADAWIATQPFPLLKDTWSGDRDPTRLIAQAVAIAAKTGISVFHRGGVRADLPSGSLNFRAIYKVLPFEHQVFSGRLNGRALLAILERGSDGLDSDLGVHGAARGPNGTWITATGETISPETDYSIAFNDFLAFGGDGFPEFKEAREVHQHPVLVRDAFVSFLTQPLDPR